MSFDDIKARWKGISKAGDSLDSEDTPSTLGRTCSEVNKLIAVAEALKTFQPFLVKLMELDGVPHYMDRAAEDVYNALAELENLPWRRK